MNFFNYSQQPKKSSNRLYTNQPARKQSHPICIFRKNPSTSLSSPLLSSPLWQLPLSTKKFYPPQLEAELHPAIPYATLANTRFSKWVWIIWWWKTPKFKSTLLLHMRALLRDLGENICLFVGIYFIGKDIVFRFIIEYSSSRDFGPY